MDTRAEALDMSKTSDKVWQVGLLYKCKTSGLLGQVFDLISFFFSNMQRLYQVFLGGKCLQEYPVNASILQSSIPWY